MPWHLGVLWPTEGVATVSITQVGLTAADSTQLNSPWDIQKSGNYVFLATNNGRITSVDVTDPTTPVIESSIDDSPGFASLNGTRGTAINVAADLLYVIARNTAGATGYALTVIDIANPSSMSIVGSVDDADLQDGFGIAWDGADHVYVAGALGLAVVDVSTPASPVVVELETTHTGLGGVVVDGGFAYATNGNGNSVIVYDISTPTAVTVEGSVTNATTLAGSTQSSKQGDFLYVACLTGDRLTVVDVSTPTTPVVAGSITGATFDAVHSAVVEGTRCFVGGGSGADFLSCVDVSDPGAMSILASVAASGHPLNFVKEGAYIYGTDANSHRVRVWEVVSTGGGSGWSL